MKKWCLFLSVVLLMGAGFSSYAHAASWEEYYDAAKQLKEKRQWGDSIRPAEKALLLAKNEFGEDHEVVLKVLDMLTTLCLFGNDAQKEEQYRLEELDLNKRIYGAVDNKVIFSLQELGHFYARQEKREMLLDAITKMRAALEENTSLSTESKAKYYLRIGRLYIKAKDFEKAKSFLDKGYDVFASLYDPHAPQYINAISDYVALYDAAMQYDLMAEFLEKIILLYEESEGDAGFERIAAICQLIECYLKDKKMKEAEAVFWETLTLLGKNVNVHGNGDVLFQNADDILVAYETTNQREQAVIFYKRFIETLEEYDLPVTWYKRRLYSILLNDALEKNDVQKMEESYLGLMQCEIEELTVSQKQMPDTFDELNKLYADAGREEERKKFNEDTLAKVKEKFGDDHILVRHIQEKMEALPSGETGAVVSQAENVVSRVKPQVVKQANKYYKYTIFTEAMRRYLWWQAFIVMLVYLCIFMLEEIAPITKEFQSIGKLIAVSSLLLFYLADLYIVSNDPLFLNLIAPLLLLLLLSLFVNEKVIRKRYLQRPAPYGYWRCRRCGKLNAELVVECYKCRQKKGDNESV